MNFLAKLDISMIYHNLIHSMFLKLQKTMNGSSSSEGHMHAELRALEIQQKHADIFTKASLITTLEADAAASRSVPKLCCFS